MGRIFVFVAISLLGLTLATTSHAEIIVSATSSPETERVHYDVGAGKSIAIPLPSSKSGEDTYTLKVVANNAVYKDITAYLVDEKNLQLFKQGQAYRGFGYTRAVTPFTIKGSTQTAGQNYLILDNSYANFVKKKIDVYITATLPMGEEQSKRLKQAFMALYQEIKNEFIFKDFNIHIEPCGQVNAFSESTTSGDIHICTELFDNVAKSNNPGALEFIFMHELGHTLLGLWKLPGNNNEDIADEFATYEMLQGGASSGVRLDRSLDFWRNRDSVAEARNMIQNGDRHSLSIQRIRNIDENIRNAKEFSARWSQQIYPHMTTKALQDIINKPSEYSNVQLAHTILKDRGADIAQAEVKADDAPRATSSIADRLKRLDSLHKQGLLSEKEYHAKREKILGEL